MNELHPVSQKFILHWGEMGTRWGINRSVAQIHALLFISEKPLHAERICTSLGVARSNVSNSLRELRNWRIVRIVHLPGDRRDHFACTKDVFEMFRIITSERKQREVDPTLSMLRECVKEATKGKEGADAYALKRLEEMLGFFELTTRFYVTMNKLSTSAVKRALRMGNRLFKVIARQAR